MQNIYKGQCSGIWPLHFQRKAGFLKNTQLQKISDPFEGLFRDRTIALQINETQVLIELSP